MLAIVICIIYWIIAICGETFLFSAFTWFNPNLFFLFPTLMCLHWRGKENIFIATFFGLSADCFSTLPFGIYGLSFLIFIIFVRWYAIKIYQDDVATLPIITGVFTLATNLLVLVLMSVFFDVRQFSWAWVKDTLIFKVLTTVLLAIPSYRLLLLLEKKFHVHLAERKF